MNRIKRKRTLIALCSFAVFLFLVIGYAAYTEQLKLKANYNVTENFNVKITNIETTNLGGHAINAEAPTYTDTTATFNTKLYLPGDYAEYTVTVVNSGNIDAYLKTIEESVANDSAIKFKLTGIVEGLSLKSESTMDFKVRIEYDVNVTEQPTDLNASYDLTLFYEQGEGTVDPGDIVVPTTPNIVYSKNVVDGLNLGDEAWIQENLIGPEDDINKIKGYTEDYTTLGHNFFLKHNMLNGKVQSNELCFIHNGLHCVKANDLETSRTMLLSVFGESACNNADSISCSNDEFGVSAYDFGNVRIDNNSGTVGCVIRSAPGDAVCYSIQR